MFLQRLLVGGSKGNRELFCFVFLTVLQGLASERKATKKPHQALGGRFTLVFLFVDNQLFKCARECGRGLISFVDFLFREVGGLQVSGRPWDIMHQRKRSRRLTSIFPLISL